MNETRTLVIEPRSGFVLDNGLHPFQQRALEEVREGEGRIIVVQAPVGAGKSKIVRDIALDQHRKDPVVLTYPTKILMETQVAALKKDAAALTIWPDDPPKPGAVQVFNYSTDALVRYMRQQNITAPPDRGSLWQRVLFTQEGMGGPILLVTTPDVLWLLFIAKVYHPARRLQNYLQNAVVIFDEFHLFYSLETFPQLVEKLLETVARKIVLLSATPMISETLRQLEQRFPTEVIAFEEARAGKQRIFNYSLEAHIHTFRHTRIGEAEQKIRIAVQELRTPAAIIMDSVFRLAHLRGRLLTDPPQGKRFLEWSGRLKEAHVGPEEGDIIMGTSSIEVGIDMVFRGAIIEAWEWPSTIQRLGRVGRHASGEVHLFTRSRDLATGVADRIEWGRTEFEHEVLRAGLTDPRMENTHGGGFRGQSLPMMMYDQDLRKAILYDEQILCQYNVSDRVENWQELTLREKRDYLIRQLHLETLEVEELLLHDALVPWWGVLQGTLADRYSRIEYLHLEPREKELTIQTDEDSFAFYGRQDG